MSNIQRNDPVESVSAFEALKLGLNWFGSDSTLRLTSHVGAVGEKLFDNTSWLLTPGTYLSVSSGTQISPWYFVCNSHHS